MPQPNLCGSQRWARDISAALRYRRPCAVRLDILRVRTCHARPPPTEFQRGVARRFGGQSPTHATSRRRCPPANVGVLCLKEVTLCVMGSTRTRGGPWLSCNSLPHSRPPPFLSPFLASSAPSQSPQTYSSTPKHRRCVS